MSRPFVAKKKVTELDGKEFASPELRLQPELAPLESLRNRLPNIEAWDRFIQRHGKAIVYIDRVNGRPASVTLSNPMLPEPDTAAAAGRGVREFVEAHVDIFQAEAAQLGATVAQEAGGSWHIRIPQQASGVPVRESMISASISSGNLVMIGMTKWETVRIPTSPGISAASARDAGIRYTGGCRPEDEIWNEPALEIWPIQANNAYGHRLVWVFGFRRRPEVARWEVGVDAHSGEIIAFRDIVRY